MVLLYADVESYLNNTVLLLMGDHGNRLDGIKFTPLGQMEERQVEVDRVSD